MEKQNSTISNGDDSNKPNNYRVKLMCSYGGKIQPRPHDHQLTYAGGDTKIFAVDRRIPFSDIVTKLTALSGADVVVSFKYQLPGEDLDALVSVIDDNDLEHMMAEYDRVLDSVSPKPARLRIFLFSASPPVQTGSDRTLTASTSPPLNPDFLFGFDKEYLYDQYDNQTRSVQEPGSSAARPDHYTGSNPRNGAVEICQPQIQGIPFTTHGGFARENSHVAGGGQVVYGIPPGYHHQMGGGPGQYDVTAVRMVPVYNYFPAMHGAPTAVMNGVGVEERGFGHVAGDEGGRSEVYNGVVGVVSPHQIGDGKTNV